MTCSVLLSRRRVWFCDQRAWWWEWDATGEPLRLKSAMRLRKFSEINGLSPLAIRNLATVELKKDEDGLNELLRERGWTSAYYSADELQAGDSVPTPSEVVRKARGS